MAESIRELPPASALQLADDIVAPLAPPLDAAARADRYDARHTAGRAMASR